MSPTGRGQLPLHAMGFGPYRSCCWPLRPIGAASGVCGAEWRRRPADALSGSAARRSSPLATLESPPMDVAGLVGGRHAQGPRAPVGRGRAAASACQLHRRRLDEVRLPRARRRGRGAVSVQVLLRQGNVGFHGAPALIALVGGPAGVGLGLLARCRSRVRRRACRIVGAMAAPASWPPMGFGVAMTLARHDLEPGPARPRRRWRRPAMAGCQARREAAPKAGADLAQARRSPAPGGRGRRASSRWSDIRRRRSSSSPRRRRSRPQRSTHRPPRRLRPAEVP